MPKAKSKKRALRPAQHQSRQPGQESEMSPRPQFVSPLYVGSGKLHGKVALITGGDSGIGRAVAVLFAREGADVAIAYLNEHDDARETCRQVELERHRCFAFAGDIGQEKTAQKIVQETVKRFGRLDLLYKHPPEQHPWGEIKNISSNQLGCFFPTYFFSIFYMTKGAMKLRKEGANGKSTPLNSSHML